MIIIHYFQLRGDKYGNHWYLSFTQNSLRCQYSPCNLLPNAVVEHDMEFNFIALIEKGQDWLDACIFFQILVHTLEVQMFSMIIYFILYWLYDGRRTVMTPASWFWGQNVRVQHVHFVYGKWCQISFPYGPLQS